MLVYSRRIKRLQELVERESACGLLISSPSNIFYFTGYRGPGVLIHSGSTLTLLVPPLEYLRAFKSIEESDIAVEIIVYQPYKLPHELVLGDPNPRILERNLIGSVEQVLGVKNCTLLFDTLSMGLDKLSDRYKLKSISDEVSKLRMIKEPWEVERIKQASMIAEYALAQALSRLEEGVSEQEIAGVIEYHMRLLGAEDHAFPPIVAFSENTVYPHAESGSRRLRQGEPVLLDLGARFKGYNSDMTRTLWFGGSPDSEFRRVAEAVLEALEQAMEFIEPGVEMEAIDAKARSVLEDYGLAKYFNHSLGHGVGIDVHELPRLSPGSKTRVEPGMVFTIEPGVYIPGKFGVRIEDTVVVTTKGARSITKFEHRLW